MASRIDRRQRETSLTNSPKKFPMRLALAMQVEARRLGVRRSLSGPETRCRERWCGAGLEKAGVGCKRMTQNTSPTKEVTHATSHDFAQLFVIRLW